MKQPATKPKRCAIYTRKSTDHNLDLTFNSLDAQREACEAYIKSQAHEGWSLVPGQFDDGAFSGASLIRPALQDLLQLVEAGKVDIIVVYKVDRLTRSLADFAKLVELFDANDVSFVSVTQSFNTTTSMGRLTLNVLLSFAQFEREVIGERVRDKIAASKKKGIWVGGPIPLGYRSVNKKLEVVPDEAALVRKIFEDYLTQGSIGQLTVSLNSQGIKPKPRQLANGKTIAAAYFRPGPLAHMLRNRFYIGDVVYHGETNPGEHEPILDRDLFDAVQARLEEQRVERKIKTSNSTSILIGLLFDDRGNPMTPSHSNKKGVRYRYYISRAIVECRKDQAGAIARVPAPDIEELVGTAVREKLEPDASASDRDLIRAKVERIIIHPNSIEITLRQAERDDDNEGATEVDEAVCLSIPFTPKQPPRKGIVHTPDASATIDARTRETLLKSIARSRRWMENIMSEKVASFEEIATIEGKVDRHVRYLAPLAFLSPNVIAAIYDGRMSADITVSSLARGLPHSWSEQEKKFGLN
jgi:site-specific DNA recombinase